MQSLGQVLQLPVEATLLKITKILLKLSQGRFETQRSIRFLSVTEEIGHRSFPPVGCSLIMVMIRVFTSLFLFSYHHGSVSFLARPQDFKFRRAPSAFAAMSVTAGVEPLGWLSLGGFICLFRFWWVIFEEDPTYIILKSLIFMS